MAGHRLERVLRPGFEPVDRAAVDERGKHLEAAAEGLAERAHGDDEVQAALHALNEERAHGRLGGGHAVGRQERAHRGGDLLAVLRLPQVGHLARVEYVVDVLEHALPDNLRVGEEEDRVAAVQAGPLQHAPQVVPPLVRPVLLRNLDLEEVKVLRVRSKAGEAAPPTASDAQQQRVPCRRSDDTADARHVLRSVEEDDELHRRGRDRVVILEVLLHDPLQS